MVQNPLALFQIVTLGVQAAVLAVSVSAICACRFDLKNHLLVPFYLRKVGWASALTACLSIAMLVWTMAQWGAMRAGHASTGIIVLFGFALALAAMRALGDFSLQTRRALFEARHASDFDRLEIYRAFAETFPGQMGPLLAQSRDTSALRILADLHRRGDRFNGEPLPGLIIEHLRDAPPESIDRFIDFGFCDGDQALEAKARRYRDESVQIHWEAILERHEAAPKVGHRLRMIIEEALARQKRKVVLRLKGEPTHKSARLTLRRIEQRLQGMFEAVQLQLVVQRDLSYATEAEDEMPFSLELELLEEEVVEHKREVIERVRKEVPEGSAHGGTTMRAVHVGKVGREKVCYPLMKMRFRLLHHGRHEAELELDSRPGAPQVNRAHAPPQDVLVNRACDTIFSALTRGSGLSVLSDENTLFTLPASSPEVRARAPQRDTVPVRHEVKSRS